MYDSFVEYEFSSCPTDRRMKYKCISKLNRVSPKYRNDVMRRHGWYENALLGMNRSELGDKRPTLVEAERMTMEHM